MKNTLAFIGILFTAFSLSSCNEPPKSNHQTSANTTKYKVGQVWKYHNRPNEDSSTFTILKIEKYEKGDTIIHIRIDGVRIYNPNLKNGESDFIGHLPFSNKAISASATTLIAEKTDIPDFAEGYNNWKDAWLKGEGGYWTVDIKEAVEGIDQSMRNTKSQ